MVCVFFTKHIGKSYPIGSMGLVYFPTNLLSKSTIHVGKYTVRPMDPTVDGSEIPNNQRLDV